MLQRRGSLLIACIVCGLLAIVPNVLSSPAGAPQAQRETGIPTNTPASTPALGYMPLVMLQPTPTNTPTPEPTPTNTPIPVPGVRVVGQTFSYVDSINYLHIIGEVQNTRSSTVQFVRLTANIFDGA